MKTWTQVMLCAALALPATAGLADKKTDTVETASGKRTTDLVGVGERKFMEKAASDGLADVRLGQLAIDKAASPTVKALGKRSVDDHEKANKELEAVAAKLRFPMPTELDSHGKATYDKLAKLSGNDFDKAYLDAMVKDHDDDVKAFKKEATMGGVNPDLKAWAQKTLGVIEQLDQQARQDKDSFKK